MSDNNNSKLCTCGVQVKTSIVRKEGPNNGRPYMHCEKRDCKFFEWADQPSSSSSFNNKKYSQSSSSSSSSVFNFSKSTNNNNNNYSNSNTTAASVDPNVPPKCTSHQEDAILRKVKKDGPNNGKLFWGCAREREEACKFFSWFQGNEADVEHLIGVNPASQQPQQQKQQQEKKRKFNNDDETNEEEDSSSNNDTFEPQIKKVKNDDNNTTFELSKYLQDDSWKQLLEKEYQKAYFKKLNQTVAKEYKEKPTTIYPKKEEIFSALNVCPYDDVKVVILGQDPYPQWYAHGMSFSVKKGVYVPQSLQNIYKELSNDSDLETPFSAPDHGHLMGWAQQGVLLLNAVLSVEKGNPNVHKGIGWETFTDAIIEQLSKKKNIVYLLWGRDAQQKGSKIDKKNNMVITTSHPSPHSADKGFLGSKCFSKCNQYLVQCGIEPINWSNLN